jgi:hypothetical protein
MVIFTFCVDIGRIPESVLITAVNCWLSGIKTSGTAVDKIIIYTNLPLSLLCDWNEVDIRRFEDLGTLNKDMRWTDLLTLKFRYYKNLLRENGTPPVWIDLDTFIANDLSYLDSIDSFCTMLGTQDKRIMSLH